MSARVVVLDYGSGNVHSAVRALERAGAHVELTRERRAVLDCDGLVVPGQGSFSAVADALAAVRGGELIERRLAGGRAVLGICVGHQVMFERSTEPYSGGALAGLSQWPGVVERLPAGVVPHMGWNTVEVAAGSQLFAGVEDQRFYFVHSYAVTAWTLPDPVTSDGSPRPGAPKVTWSRHGERFVAAVENGPLWSTQFHPEKSGEPGARLLRNWLATL